MYKSEQWPQSSLSEEYSSYFLCLCGAEFDYSAPYMHHVQQCQTTASTFSQQHSTSKTEETHKGLSKQAQPQNQFAGQKGKRGPLKWNGFVLIKNQHVSSDEPFFCGKCDIIFFKIAHFITHCIEVCQSIRHPLSSHSITHQADIQAGKAGNYRLTEEEYKPFIKLLSIQADHRLIVPFYCGECQLKLLDCATYGWHMNSKHYSTVPPESSHVLLQFLRRGKKNSLYISSSLQWHIPDHIYCCPCSPKNKISMAQLLTHIKQTHHGLSPIYRMVLSTTKEGQIWKIRQILDERLDHRNEPFFCGHCCITIRSSMAYIKHMTKVHSQRIPNGSSHVILRLIKKKTINYVYLTKLKEWENEEADYYCPCQPWRKMHMRQLIDHLQSSHAGLSPYYFITLPQPNQNQPVALSSDSDENSDHLYQ